MIVKRPRLVLVLLAGLAVVVWVVTTGDEHKDLLFDEHPGARGVAADRAFVELVVPEERVRMALAKAAHADVHHLALGHFAARISRQTRAERRELLAIAPEIDADIPRGFGPSVAQGDADSGALGLVGFEAGLSVRPFGLPPGAANDPAFINRIIRLDQGAVRIGRAVYSQGAVKPLKKVALAILKRRFAEILQLNRWYQRWYGRPSKAGGLPAPP
jgi:uncharacterized protein (DUF305 family)